MLFGNDDKSQEKCIKEKDEGDEKEKESKKKSEIRSLSIPRNILWPGEVFINDEDLDAYHPDDELIDNEEIIPENNMELAIYLCKGKFNH